MKAWVIKKGNQFLNNIQRDEFGSLKEAHLYPTKERAVRLADIESREKVVPIEIQEIK